MPRRYPLLVLLSLFVVAVTAWNCTMQLRFAGLPFALDRVNPTMARVKSLHGIALPPELKPTDRVHYVDQITRLRMDLLAVIELSSTEPGHTMPLVVTHEDGTKSEVPVQARTLFAEPAFRVSMYLGFAWYLLLCLITLMVLWRGRDRTAWGIALWAIAFECGMAFYLIPAHDRMVLAFALASQVCFLLARIGFFVMASAIAAPALSERGRRAWLYAFVFSLIVGYGYEVTYVLWFVFDSILIPKIAALIWVVPYAISTAMLLLAHRRAAAAARPRLRWMFWSAVVLVFGILLSNVAFLGYTTSYVIEIACFLIAFAGLLYSVLRHRVVDISFVVNRAIVYSVAVTLIVAIFMVIESFAEKLALSHGESFALELGVPLVIGFSLEAIRKRLEHFGERLFFRRKFENDAALRAFTRQCSYVENPDRLLEQTMRELATHTGTPAVAFYWRDRNDYRRLADGGEARYPERLDGDDRAVVALRADREAMALEEHESVLGSDGGLLPMVVRGELLGFIVIASRPGERYAPDEREILARLAHEVGSALHALHARENARFISAVAEGNLGGQELRERARVLMPPA
ncbi:MAG TPA: GAF domain-containing protein [Gammaproteobacteria bacterium]|nr:GAF domain-containing protein [Gammaproteobacteria bacterium]